MRRNRLYLYAGVAITGIAASVAFSGMAMATPHTASAPAAVTPAANSAANGDIATTEYWYPKPTSKEVVTISAFHWANEKSVSYTIISFKTKQTVTTGTVTLTAGAGMAQITGLAGGTYQLDFSHKDSTAATVTFGVNCDGTC